MSKVASNLQPTASFGSCERPNVACPNCGARGVTTFYAVENIPVHSCLLMPSRKAALEYPKGNLELGFCRACAFVFNALFDASVHEYSTRYEETQGFSATFNNFARSLAQDLIDKHDLRGKTILEIGCGKGEFLTLLCQLADNRGIGIDPGYIPERTEDKAASRIEFIQDFYSDKHADLAADFICCRHTLEHIAPTGEFMKTLRRTIGDQPNTTVFFELPDVYRVLREGAFWDIYYEHCTYFSLGSLARLFRHTGFNVTELETAYDDQYLLITALPADGPTSPRLDSENDLAAMTDAVTRFQKVGFAVTEKWRRRISDILSRGEKVVLWGSGSKGVAFLTTLGLTDQIQYVVDINPYRHNHFMPGSGQEIVSPEFLADYKPEHVIVMNPIYCREIQSDLDRIGVKASIHAV